LLEPEISRTFAFDKEDVCIPMDRDFGQLLYECQLSGRMIRDVKIFGENNEELHGNSILHKSFKLYNPFNLNQGNIKQLWNMESRKHNF